MSRLFTFFHWNCVSLGFSSASASAFIYVNRKLLGLKGVTGSFSVTSLQVLDDNDQIDDKDVDNNENEDDEIDQKDVDVHDSGDDGLEDDFVDLQSWLLTCSQSKSKRCSGGGAGGPSRTSCHR